MEINHIVTASLGNNSCKFCVRLGILHITYFNANIFNGRHENVYH